jgi:hypothetical protein
MSSRMGLYALVIQLFPSQSHQILTGCGYDHNSVYLLDIYQCLNFVYSSMFTIPLTDFSFSGSVVIPSGYFI